jgi:hypothetical protein
MRSETSRPSSHCSGILPFSGHWVCRPLKRAQLGLLSGSSSVARNVEIHGAEKPKLVISSFMLCLWLRRRSRSLWNNYVLMDSFSKQLWPRDRHSKNAAAICCEFWWLTCQGSWEHHSIIWLKTLVLVGINYYYYLIELQIGFYPGSGTAIRHNTKKIHIT